jgi:ABC-type Mn2+/Zn2+ transport system permease subunit
VAAENFWGSIATQVGGAAVSVDAVITNPAADPHDYEPTPADARAMAGADLVIVNGVGYDPWATTLLAASPGPLVLDVGDLVGAKDGDNPHLWYNPSYVRTFISELARDLKTLDPAGNFAHASQVYETIGLKRYDDLIATIRRRFAGTAVGASESIFAMLAPALGLHLVTPPRFLRAISEGSDVSAADDVVIGSSFAWILGLGVLFLTLYTTSRSAGGDGKAGVSVLFGSIFGLSASQAYVAAAIGLGVTVATLAIARPLLFASVDEPVAAARGVPVRLLAAGFLVLLGVTAAEATQAVGSLLLLGLLAAPAGAAHRLTVRPFRALMLSAAFAIGSIWFGLALAYAAPSLPPSFAIMAVATAIFAAAYAVSGLRRVGTIRCAS